MKTKAASKKSSTNSQNTVKKSIKKQAACALDSVAGMLADIEKGNLKELLRLAK